jgi:hypothetical protein
MERETGQRFPVNPAEDNRKKEKGLSVIHVYLK